MQPVNQQGFSLFELMIAITIIAILTAIALPAYQGYVQKAALTDMLQQSAAYKNAIELCAFDTGSLSSCNNNSQGIAGSKSSQYIKSITVSAGVITITGQNALTGLNVKLFPELHATDGTIIWSKQCTSNPKNEALEASCKQLFRYQSKAA